MIIMHAIVESDRTPNEPDGANRRRRFGFRELVGEAGVAGFTAAVAHLKRSAASLPYANQRL